MRPLLTIFVLLASFVAIETQANEISEMEAYQLEVCRERLKTRTGNHAIISARECLDKIKKEKQVSPKMKTMLQDIDNVLPSKRQLKLNNPLKRLELQTANVEILANSAAWGAATGYYLTAIALSANRTDESSSNAWIGTMPPLGALTGVTLGLVLNRWLEPEPGTVAWATANTWLGLIWGQTLGNLVLADNTEVKNIPFTFAFPFLSMSLLPAATYAIGEHWHVSPGDVAIANSAAFWVTALTLPYLALIDYDRGAHIIPTLLPLSMLTHFGMMAAAPLFDIPRNATWVLEAGAGIGFVTGLAALITGSLVLSVWQSQSSNRRNTNDRAIPTPAVSAQVLATTYFTGTTALGLVGGAVILGTQFSGENAQAQKSTAIKDHWAKALQPRLSPFIINNYNQKNASVSGVLASWQY